MSTLRLYSAYNIKRKQKCFSRLTKITEVGIQYRQIKRWTVRKPKCFKNILFSTGLTIYEFAPHLLILVIGMLLSAFIFAYEVIKWNFRELDGHSAND